MDKEIKKEDVRIGSTLIVYDSRFYGKKECKVLYIKGDSDDTLILTVESKDGERLQVSGFQCFKPKETPLLTLYAKWDNDNKRWLVESSKPIDDTGNWIEFKEVRINV